MLIVLSDPKPVPNEAFHINQLFGEGLAVFHVRKPDATAEEMTALLKKIDAVNYSKIALHTHHSLAEQFGITRLHYKEVERKKMRENAEDKSKEFIFSTSIHALSEYNNLSDRFAYAFLGPVFDSISKTNYKAMDLKDRVLPARKKGTAIIALGGINGSNCTIPLQWGFDGIALLGALWLDQDNLIRNFKTIQSRCSMTAQ